MRQATDGAVEAAGGGATGGRPPPPFRLPERAPVTRVRQTDPLALRRGSGVRTQEMPGFEGTFTDIVDYIVRITEEIWVDRAIGRIYDTYDHACVIYSQFGIVRSVEEVIASSVATLTGYPDGELHHLNVAWSGDGDEGFHTSHLGYSRSTNAGWSGFGPPTGRRIGVRFAADCVSRGNKVHTEWLVRDNGAALRQMGLDVHETARRLAESPAAEQRVVSPPTRLLGQAPRAALDADVSTPQGWVRVLYDRVWNARRLDLLPDYYADDVVCHAGGGRVACGLRNLSALILAVLTSLPDATLTVEHVSWSDETDGVILAARWRLEGSTAPGGVLGPCPAGRPVSMMGVSHMRLAGDRIAEEWMVFDEVGVLVNAFRR